MQILGEIVELWRGEAYKHTSVPLVELRVAHFGVVYHVMQEGRDNDVAVLAIVHRGTLGG